jgi:ABC-type nickel/cobalt efflux system permease component RcnA
MVDKNATEVAVAQIAAISISMSDVQLWLQMASLILAVSFGIYKWYKEIKNIKNSKGVKK